MDTCEEHEPVSTYYSISAADKSKIPFTGTDTLVYFSSDGDTAILYGQGKKAYNEKVAVDRDHDPGCGKYDYNYFENIEFTYQGSHPDLNYFFIDFNAGIYAPIQTNADLKIGAVTYSVYLGRMNNSSNYQDSVTINSTIYLGRKLFSEENEESLHCLYNYQYGFLQITTLNKVWLKQI
jgi:hypothetical protein